MNSPRQKNVIWIFGDQHRGQALGLHGDPNVLTPNIDRLAREGMDFPNARTNDPLCCPARGSLLTSLYPHECVPGHEYRMPEACRTVAHAFHEHHHETAWFGKWHLDGFKEATGRAAFHTVPPERRGGFDTWIGYENNNSQYDCWVHGHDAAGAEIARHRLPGYETDALTDLLIDFLKKKQKEQADGAMRPFFAGLSVQPPHDPYVAPEEFARRHRPESIILRPNVPPVESIAQRSRADLAGYYAMIENIDWNLGRVRDALRETGLEESTYILFFSDHGDLHGSHGQFRKTSPLEESVRVPFIIGGPSADRPAEHECPALLNLMDIAPTSLGLCGIDKPANMRGCDLSGIYRQDRPRPEYPESVFLQSVICPYHWDTVDRPWRGIVTSDGWKLACMEGQPWMLFDLNEDPCEMVNMASNFRYAAKRSELLVRLREWIEETGDTFGLPGN
jgi:arylsulfatase A-like enzyme